MEDSISDKVHLAKTVNPADNTSNVESVDYSINFEDIDKEMNQLKKLLRKLVMDADLLRYLPEMLPVAYLGMIYPVRTKNIIADWTDKDLKALEFHIKLSAYQYMNWNSVYLWISIKIKKMKNEGSGSAANKMAVNIFSLFFFFGAAYKRNQY